MNRYYCAFDLDGVLVDMDRVHLDALNEALATCGPQAVITEAEHLGTFKGLPTRVKLRMLSEAGRLTALQAREVARLKQELTLAAIRLLEPDQTKIDLFSRLHRTGWELCVCSNAVRASVRDMLIAGGYLGFLAFWLSNEDAPPKPDPGMYILASKIFGIDPARLVVVEDSAPGRKAAVSAGCQLIAVEGPDEVGIDLFSKLCAAAERGICSAVAQGS